MDSQTQIDTEQGNTKKPVLRSRCWFLTYNNPPDWDTLIRTFDFSGVLKYCFQLEKGLKEETDHFQGVVYFENARTFDQMKQIDPKIHWEVCKDVRKALEYCCKFETRIAGPWVKGFKIEMPLMFPKEWKEWQSDLLMRISYKPNDRNIVWIYDEAGGHGKTTLVKYIVSFWKNRAIAVQGRGNDIKYAIANHLNQGKDLDVVCFIFPRSVEEYVSYDAIESVKDGLFFSSKYESGMCVFRSPHVFVFANFLPEMDKLTSDRWEIIRL